MRNFLIHSGTLIVLVALISCAGAPVEDHSVPMNSEAVEESAEPAQVPVPFWKPAELISSYVDGTVDKTITYSYSDNGELLQTVEIDGRGNLLLEKSFEYENGYLVKETASDSASLISVTMYNLNKDNQVEEQVKKDDQGEILSVVRFEYDGDLVKTAAASDASGIPLLVNEYEYQDEQVVSVLYKTSSGAEEARFERVLDDGVVMREQTVLPDGTIETARDFIYKDGRNTEIIHYAGGSKVKSTALGYDDYGNIILEVWSDRSGREYSVIERSWIQFEDIK